MFLKYKRSLSCDASKESYGAIRQVPSAIKFPRRYLDRKSLRISLKGKKADLLESEKKLVRRVNAARQTEGMDIGVFLSALNEEGSMGMSAEEIAELSSCFESWDHFITSDNKDLERISISSGPLINKHRRCILQHIGLYQHGLWPYREKCENYKRLFKGGLLNEGLAWTSTEDERLSELVDKYNLSFGNPWIYVSWEMKRSMQEVSERYITTILLNKRKSELCEFTLSKSLRPILLSSKFNILLPTAIVVPRGEFFNTRKFNYVLPAAFRAYRDEKCFMS